MTHRLTRAAIALAMLLSAPVEAAATQSVVYAQVTNVQPIRESQRLESPASCKLPKPTAASLAELLAWDLQPQCVPRTSSRVSAYRVEYRWDGRTYSQTMAEHPGARVPLRLRLR